MLEEGNATLRKEAVLCTACYDYLSGCVDGRKETRLESPFIDITVSGNAQAITLLRYKRPEISLGGDFVTRTLLWHEAAGQTRVACCPLTNAQHRPDTGATGPEILRI